MEFRVNEYLQANHDRWDELAPLHAAGTFYRVDEFKAGRSALHRVEREEMGDVTGKTLLHLQCHFGLDTLSWAREGAHVTGVDYSEAAIDIARELAHETGLDARFVHTNVYELPEALDGQFDIVFTSWGAICWLPDLRQWAEVIARFLRPGGVFYMMETHPFAWVFDDADPTGLRVRYPYFPQDEPIVTDEQGSYADAGAALTHTRTYNWPHSLSEILGALIDAGLRIDFLHEHQTCAWQIFPFAVQDDEGMWRLPDRAERLPLSFSIKATRPA